MEAISLAANTHEEMKKWQLNLYLGNTVFPGLLITEIAMDERYFSSLFNERPGFFSNSGIPWALLLYSSPTI